jgi:hypothetical protein
MRLHVPLIGSSSHAAGDAADRLAGDPALRP